MRIESATRTHKTMRGRVTGYTAHYRDLETTTQRATKPEAMADLGALLDARCDAQSANVKVLCLRGHIGIFSYGLAGYVDSRHLYPEDKHVTLCSGYKTIQEAEDSFRHHVAQLTWDGTVAPCDILPERLQREFRSWCEFQLRYKLAIKNGMVDIDAHAWACDSRNPHSEESRHSFANDYPLGPEANARIACQQCGEPATTGQDEGRAPFWYHCDACAEHCRQTGHFYGAKKSATRD